MALGDFFRISLPYGMMRSQDAEKWAIHNREYSPLGFNGSGGYHTVNDSESPLYVEYTRLTEKQLLTFAWDSVKGVKRNEQGEIVHVFFYNDATNPEGSPVSSPLWKDYFKCLQKLSKLKSTE